MGSGSVAVDTVPAPDDGRVRLELSITPTMLAASLAASLLPRAT